MSCRRLFPISTSLRVFLAVTFVMIAGGTTSNQLSANISTEEYWTGSRLLERKRIEHSLMAVFQQSVLVDTDFLISDSLPPNSSKVYRVNVLDHSLLVLNIEGKTSLSKMRVEVEDPQSNTTVERCYVPEMSDGYIHYIRERGALCVKFTNHRSDTVDYMFFVDASELLEATSHKSVPIAGGIVAFHVDLKRDDMPLLELASSSQASLTMRAYTPYYRITGAMAGYMLRSYTDESNKALSFTAHLEGRYYILIRSAKAGEVFSLLSEIKSPSWNRWWFWPLLSISTVAAVTFLLYFEMKKAKDLEEIPTCVVLSDYCLLVALCLWSCSIGAYLYRTHLLIIIFHSSTLFLGLNLAFRIYADQLLVKQMSKVSNTWYLTTIGFGVFSSLVLAFLLGFGFSEWWNGIGSVAGGIVAWAINRKVDRKKAWGFAVSGIVFSLSFPILSFLFKETVFQPFVTELYAPALGSYIFRVASPYQTLPKGFILCFAALVAGVVFLLIRELRNILSAFNA